MFILFCTWRTWHPKYAGLRMTNIHNKPGQCWDHTARCRLPAMTGSKQSMYKCCTYLENIHFIKLVLTLTHSCWGWPVFCVRCIACSHNMHSTTSSCYLYLVWVNCCWAVMLLAFPEELEQHIFLHNNTCLGSKVRSLLFRWRCGLAWILINLSCQYQNMNLFKIYLLRALWRLVLWLAWLLRLRQIVQRNFVSIKDILIIHSTARLRKMGDFWWSLATSWRRTLDWRKGECQPEESTLRVKIKDRVDK